MSKINLSRNDFQAFWPASIRYYELDPQGVVHNARYVSFFDEAITGYFKYVNYDYWSDIEETRKDFHTVQVTVQYNKPLMYAHEIEIGTKIKEIGNSSITWQMGMFLKDSDELVSSCEAVHVYTDQITMKSTPITDELKAKLKFN